MRPSKPSIGWKKITESRLFFPIAALTLILLFDLIFIPGFFNITLQQGHLYGSLVDILRNSTPVIAIAIGMTLVIATGGVDLSVGAIMAIVSSIAAILMNPYFLGKVVVDISKFSNDPTYSYSPFWVVILVPMLVATICGLWNGMLVAYGRIQPMVATLILMIAGRGIAQLITNSQKIQIFYQPFTYIGNGWILLPFSVFIVAASTAWPGWLPAERPLACSLNRSGLTRVPASSAVSTRRTSNYSRICSVDFARGSPGSSAPPISAPRMPPASA